MSYMVREDVPRAGYAQSGLQLETTIRLGVVSEEHPAGNTGETLYTVLVSMQGKDVPIVCVRMVRFGGLYNYEEYNPQIYNDSLGVGNNTPFAIRPGDSVVVAFLDGRTRKGIILGGIRHPARKEQLTASGKPAYISRINGIENKITEDGKFTVTYKGSSPLNDPQMLLPPGKPLVEVQDDPVKGGSNFGFDVDGNFNINDGDSQNIIVSRDNIQGGNIKIVSGTTTITIAGGLSTQEVTIDTKGDISLSALKNITAEGLDISLSAKKTIAIEAKLGISITAKGNELLDLLTQLIDEIGGLTVSSPVGPCSPIMGAPTWAKVTAVQAKLKLMMG